MVVQIELRPIDSIKPYDKNPRLNNGAVQAVARSLHEFKVRQPIVVDSEGVIVGKHTGPLENEAQVAALMAKLDAAN